MSRELERNSPTSPPRGVVDDAAASLVERYRLTPSDAVAFLEGKAGEDGREVADVAAEVLRGPSPPEHG